MGNLQARAALNRNKHNAFKRLTPSIQEEQAHIFIGSKHEVHDPTSKETSLLVERLGVGGGGSDVGIAGSLVGAGLLLEGLGGGKVGATSSLVGLLVVTSGLDEVSDGGSGEKGEHYDVSGNS